MLLLTNLLYAGIKLATPLFIGALGETYAQRTGVMVIAIEGIFLMGAWSGFVAAFYSNLYVGILAAAGAGILISAFYGYVTIKLKRNQIVTGVAINIAMFGLSLYLFRVVFGVRLVPVTVQPFEDISVPVLSRIPVIGRALFSQNIYTYLALILLVAGYYVLFRTHWGLTLRSLGENPAAVDSAGINVERTRMGAVVLAGALQGIAGSFYSLGYLGLFTQGMIGGRGWIAFAACFFGNWNPLGAFGGALLFGVADSLSTQFLTSGFNMIPTEFIVALPYILVILGVLFRSGIRVPKYLGIQYRKEEG